MPEALTMFVIYDRPTDYPEGFVVREWQCVRGMVVPGKLLAAELETLDAAREILPPGLYNLGRQPEDDAKIVEVWL